MKVTGPGQGPGQGAPPGDAVGATDAAKPAETAPVQRETLETFADKLEAGGAPEAARLPGPALERALQQVLDRVIEEQLGAHAADAPAAVRERLRAALRDTLENDPFLAEQLRKIQDR